MSWYWDLTRLLAKRSATALSTAVRGTPGYHFAVAASRIEFLRPWAEFEPSQAGFFLLELARELGSNHPLYGVELEPLGHSRAADDVLFATRDGRVVEVHLTFSSKAETPPWPGHKYFANLGEWVEQVMLPERDGYD